MRRVRRPRRPARAGGAVTVGEAAGEDREVDAVTFEVARIEVWRPLRRQGRVASLLDALARGELAVGADALLVENVVNASLAAALRRRGWTEVRGERRADWEGMRAGRYVAPLNRSFYAFVDQLQARAAEPADAAAPPSDRTLERPQQPQRDPRAARAPSADDGSIVSRAREPAAGMSVPRSLLSSTIVYVMCSILAFRYRSMQCVAIVLFLCCRTRDCKNRALPLLLRA